MAKSWDLARFLHVDHLRDRVVRRHEARLMLSRMAQAIPPAISQAAIGTGTRERSPYFEAGRFSVTISSGAILLRDWFARMLSQSRTDMIFLVVGETVDWQLRFILFS